MEFDSIAKVFGALILLLPGFLAVRLRRLFKEYEVEGTFELSTASLSFSFLILLFWVVVNVAWQAKVGIIQYPFLPWLKEVLFAAETPDIVGSWVWIGVISYVGASFVIVLGVVIWTWSHYGHFFLVRVIGYTHKTAFLTPWDDMPALAVGHWVAIETTDNHTYLGIIRYISHHPFPREIIIGGTNSHPMQLYFAREAVFHSVPPKYLYVRGENIRSVTVIDTGMERSLKINSWSWEARRSPLLRNIIRLSLRSSAWVLRFPYGLLSFFYSIFVLAMMYGFLLLGQSVAGFIRPSYGIIFLLMTALIVLWACFGLCKIIRSRQSI